MKRSNPPVDVAMASIAPLLPYVVVGGIIYFWGPQIFAWLGSKITGVNYEDYRKAQASVASASAKDIGHALTGNIFQAKYIPPAEQKKQLEELRKSMGFISGVKVPYPKPASQAEFRANIAAINKAKGWKR